jgi:hypothetical protein
MILPTKVNTGDDFHLMAITNESLQLVILFGTDTVHELTKRLCITVLFWEGWGQGGLYVKNYKHGNGVKFRSYTHI